GADVDQVAADGLIARVRWFAAGLAVLQFVLAAPPFGEGLPYSRWWGALPVSMVVAINLVGLVRQRVRGPGVSVRWALAQVVGDGVTVLTLLAMFAYEPHSPLWAMLIVPVLEA